MGMFHCGGRRRVETRRLRLCVEELEARLVPAPCGPALAPVTQTFSVVTLSGQSASLLLGGEQRVPQPGSRAVVFQPFGTQLQVLPTVLGDGTISLQLDVDQAVPGGRDGPHGVSLDTTVSLRGGETLALTPSAALPFPVLVTPQLVEGPAALVEVTVTETLPGALVAALPAAVQPTALGQPAITDTYQLTALSGQAASLRIGGEQFLAGGTVLPFGTQLNVLPTVEGDGTIRLDVQAEASTPGSVSGPPAFTAEHLALSVQTSVAVASGQTIVLAAAPGLPFQVLVTPRLISGAGQPVAVTVQVAEPPAFAAALPRAQPAATGQATVTSRYALTALSGSTASLFIGGQTDWPAPGGTAGRIGAQVSVVPTVLAGGKIQLAVALAQTAPNGGLGLPALSLDTTVELQSGQTLLIGSDQKLPCAAFITPQLVAGASGLVAVTIKAVTPARFATAALFNVPPGQTPVTQTLTVTAPSGGSANLTTAGMQVTVQPTILGNGNIMLGIDVQQGTTRKRGMLLTLETTVSVQAGQTLALGGAPKLPFEVLASAQPGDGNTVTVTVTVEEPRTQ